MLKSEETDSEKCEKSAVISYEFIHKRSNMIEQIRNLKRPDSQSVINKDF